MLFKGKLRDKDRLVVFLALLVGATIGLIASTVLSYEALILARDSNKVLSCDINAVVSCGTVARHWSSHVIGDIPNSFVGMIAFPVFITIAVAGLARTKFPRWFMRAAEAGAWLSLLLAGWMFYMSYVVIGSLCPWCLTTDVGVLIVLFAIIRHNTLSENPMISKKYVIPKRFIEQNYDIAALIGIIVIVSAMIIAKYGQSLL